MQLIHNSSGNFGLWNLYSAYCLRQLCLDICIHTHYWCSHNCFTPGIWEFVLAQKPQSTAVFEHSCNVQRYNQLIPGFLASFSYATVCTNMQTVEWDFPICSTCFFTICHEIFVFVQVSIHENATSLHIGMGFSYLCNLPSLKILLLQKFAWDLHICVTCCAWKWCSFTTCWKYCIFTQWHQIFIIVQNAEHEKATSLHFDVGFAYLCKLVSMKIQLL